MQQQCIAASRLFGAIQICFEEIDKNEFGQMFSHSRIVKKNSGNMELYKWLVFLILWNNSSQESFIPTEFLERFIAAHGRHSTVVITERNSGK